MKYYYFMRRSYAKIQNYHVLKFSKQNFIKPVEVNVCCELKRNMTVKGQISQGWEPETCLSGIAQRKLVVNLLKRRFINALSMSYYTLLSQRIIYKA